MDGAGATPAETVVAPRTNVSRRESLPASPRIVAGPLIPQIRKGVARRGRIEYKRAELHAFEGQAVAVSPTERSTAGKATAADDLAPTVIGIGSDVAAPRAPDAPRFGVPDDVPAAFRSGPFAALPGPVQRRLRREMTPVEFPAGTTVFRRNDDAHCLYVVDRGIVSVFFDGADGSTVELGDLASGDVLGEMALISREPRTATAVARADVRLLALPADRFEEICRSQPAVAQVLTNVMADRLGSHRFDALSSKSLNGYEIDRRLGRGGMSVVYRATHRASGEAVALKMMSHRLIFDPSCCERFDYEGELVAALRHPNIPRVRDRFPAFRTRFIVLELIDGETLADLCPSGCGLPEAVVLKLLGQAASALQYAHSFGVVHRDLKPANLMLDRRGTLKLLDFGLAIPFQGDDQPASTAGTLPYMAPEQ
ncbi:MAG TPA: cyclic nucleotide-binding domain-containing protein, partial [Planctomycetaceae bacterium]